MDGAHLKKEMEHNLGNDYKSLYEYFQKIVNGKYDFMVFISRRCYILFQMFAIIAGWNFDNVCTDLGIFAHRERLKASRRIIVADDIGYTGRSMQNVLKRISMYVPVQCVITAVVFAVNRKWADEIFSRKRGLLRRVNVKCRFQLTNHQCQDLSIRLVAAILDSGIPYTTFVYPILGKKKKDIDKDYKITAFRTEKGLFEKHKWETHYLDIGDNDQDLKWTHRLGKYTCIRIYRDPHGEEGELFLPFIFLKDIKKDKVNAWYEGVADTFAEMQCAEAAEELRKALSVHKKWQENAGEYLTSVMSCFCSKALAEILDLSQYVSVQKEEAGKFLKGSFSSTILQLLEACDADFAIRFFDNLFAKMENCEEYFCDDTDREGIVVDKLTEYVTGHCKDMDVYETTYSIYEWLKSDGSNVVFKDQPTKAICVEDIVYVLKKVSFAERDIYLAQIECWDIGVATYRLCYDKERGIAAKCSAGEMSAVIPMLKYQDLIREYFREKFALELEGDNSVDRNILAGVMQKAMDDKKYTEHEIDAFKSLVEERNGSLYGLLLIGAQL